MELLSQAYTPLESIFQANLRPAKYLCKQAVVHGARECEAKLVWQGIKYSLALSKVVSDSLSFPSDALSFFRNFLYYLSAVYSRLGSEYVFPDFKLHQSRK